MSKLNVFFISIAAPPSSGAESLQVAKYIKYMSANSNVHLITGKPEQRGWNKAELKLQEYVKQIKSRLELKTKENRYKDALLRNLKVRKKPFPDHYYLFAAQEKKVIANMQVKPDILYSRSSPFSTALLTVKLKHHYNVPWVMHFSDPWWGNPYHEESHQSKSKAAEIVCMENADLLTFTSEQTKQLYVERYPEHASKFEVMPNVYDAVDAVPPNFDFTPEKIKFVHTGNFYGKRSPAPFLAALKQIRTKTPELLEQAEFIFAGHLNDAMIDLFTAINHPNVRYIGNLTADGALNLQKEAHILVFIDKPNETPLDRVFFPSKIQDYMAAGKPMLGVTDLKSSSAECVENRYGKCFDHDDTEGLSAYLTDAIGAYRIKNSAFFAVEEADETYAAEYNATRLLKLFERLC